MTRRTVTSTESSRGIVRVAAATALAFCLAGCGDLLEVSNPGTLREEQLSDPALEQFVINGVIGEFQAAYVNYVFWSGVLADEVYTDHNNASFQEFSLHKFNDLSQPNDSVYKGLQRARQAADDAVDLVKKMQGPGATSSVNVARALIYGAYSYLLLGEGFCESPVNLSAPLPPEELFARAIDRFDEGIAVAAAAPAASSGGGPTAKELISMGHVGAARASLRRGDLANARDHALLVSPTYEGWAYYSANAPRENNSVQLATRGTNPWLGMQPTFRGLNDPRVPEPATSRPSLRSNPIYPPSRPSMYSGWTGAPPAQAIEVASNIRFASALEARYIVVEAEGPNASMLTFVNGRRAVAGAAPLISPSAAALLAEFRAQRARDFYLTGQRLGDLRRYAAAGIDLFPAGTFPVGAETYGSMHCFIVPRSEKAVNPHF